MKKQTIVYDLLLMLLAAACSKGPQGDIGPLGAKGAVGDVGAKGGIGDAGTKGGTGETGNSNVIYTEWRSPDFKEPFSGLPNRQQFEGFDMPFPLLTQETLNTSQVFIYAKNRQLVTENNVLKLVENIHEVSTPMTVSYYLFPGRTGLSANDYGSHSVSLSSLLRPNVITINTHALRLAPGGTDVSTTVNVTVPEMANKTPAFYRDFMKDLVKFRVVIVKGNVAGRQAAVDMEDYEGVKKAYNLKD